MKQETLNNDSNTVTRQTNKQKKQQQQQKQHLMRNKTPKIVNEFDKITGPVFPYFASDEDFF